MVQQGGVGSEQVDRSLQTPAQRQNPVQLHQVVSVWREDCHWLAARRVSRSLSPSKNINTITVL